MMRASTLVFVLGLSLGTTPGAVAQGEPPPRAAAGATGQPAPTGAASQPATSADEPPDDVAYEETVVVTATRTMHRIQDVPAAISVLTAEQLDRLPVRSLDDALRNVPGVDIAKMSGMAARGNSQVTIRGVPGTRRALLLIDGIAANDLGFGSLAELDLVPVKGLQRVEVVRGPFSSLYGANAFGGVFNLITRRGAGPVTVEPFGAVGNAGYFQYGFTSQGGTDRVGYSLTVDRRRIDNVFGRDTQVAFAPSADGRSLVETTTRVANQDYADTRLVGRVDVRFTDRVSLTLLPRLNQFSSGFGHTPRLPTPAEAYNDVTGAHLGSILDVNGGPRLKWQFKQGVRWSNNQLYQENFTTTPVLQTITLRPGPVPVSTVTRTEFPLAALTRETSKYLTTFVEPGATWSLSKAHTLTVGASYTREHGDFSPHVIVDAANVLGSDAMLAGVARGIQAGMLAGGAPNPTVSMVRETPIGTDFPKTPGNVETINNLAFYAQDEWTVGTRAHLVPGIRLDNHSEFGAVVSPKLGVVLTLSNQARLRLSGGRAYRAPSLSELYGTIVFHGPIPGLPNPDLKPEYVNALDGGFLLDIGRSGHVEANAFFNHMKDLIQLQLLPTGDRFDWVNVSRSRSAGLELTTSGRAMDWLNLSAHYGYTWTRDLDLDRALDQVPAHKVFLSADGARAFGRMVVTGGLTWRWYDQRLQDYRSVITTLDAYSRTDASASVGWGGRTRFVVTAQNLFDQTYQESAVNLAPGRLFSIGLDLAF